jgi:hypothetical protein
MIAFFCLGFVADDSFFVNLSQMTTFFAISLFSLSFSFLFFFGYCHFIIMSPFSINSLPDFYFLFF